MTIDRWRAYMHGPYPEETLRDWARRLHRFRFVRAVGGHANDADELLVVIRYRDIAELRNVAALLGIVLEEYSAEPPRPHVGQAYASDVYAQFPSLIPGTCWIRQPGLVSVAGESAFIWCTANDLELSVGSSHEVTEEDVRAAERLERAIGDLRVTWVDPPRDRKHCVCPRYYPDWFRA